MAVMKLQNHEVEDVLGVMSQRGIDPLPGGVGNFLQKRQRQLYRYHTISMLYLTLS
jgi:hypothetical protein